MTEPPGPRHAEHYTRKLYGEGYVTNLYDDEYAEQYDELWQLNPEWRAEVEHYVESFRQCLDPGDRWLDVGCGTGWFLSQFPGVERAGLDISPAMLRRAEVSNPDALFFRQGDFRVDVPEWHDSWDLVSATGQCWGYVDHISEIATIVDNMAKWTAPEGTLMVQAPDLWDLTGLRRNEHYDTEAPADDPIHIVGVLWSIRDEAGVHPTQIWPQFDVWVRWLSAWFRRIEIVWWPHDPPMLPCPRRLLLATGKREDGDDTPVEIIERDLFGGLRTPRPTGEPPKPVVMPARVTAAAAAGTAPIADVVASVETDTHHAPGLRRSDDVPSEPVVPGPGERIPGRRLLDQPFSYLLGRIRPGDPAFWRALARRVRRAVAR